MSGLRFITYLAPGLPLELFEVVARHVAVAAGKSYRLHAETRFSGPPADILDPFSAGEADVGFLCSPAYLRLSALRPSPVRLVPAACVFLDPRAEGRPVYFSDVIVRRESSHATFLDMRGRRWAYNDGESKSGYECLVQKLRDLEGGDSFLTRLRESGSHRSSIRLVMEGEVDGAAIDSNVLAIAFREEPALRRRIRVLESWGPNAVQPVVASAALSPGVRAILTGVFLGLHRQEDVRPVFARASVSHFAPVTESFYEDEKRVGTLRSVPS